MTRKAAALTRGLAIGICGVGATCAPGAFGAGDKAGISLDQSQAQAVGIMVERAPAVHLPERIDAQGLVLDPAQLAAEAGGLDAARAADQTAAAELKRLRTLHDGGANASLKALEAAQAEAARTRAQAAAAAAQFLLHWGPLAALPAPRRDPLLAELARGRGLLLRADVLGRHALGQVPQRALLDVDGVQVPGQVLGLLPQAGEFQSVGLLVKVGTAPAGLGPGARLPVVLLTAAHAGRLLRPEAIFYDERGAYVYVRLPARGGDGQAEFRAQRVTLLHAAADGWLADGLDDDDEVVVRGAGALWSLQETHGQAADGDDD